MAAKDLRLIYTAHECLGNFQMPTSKTWRLSFQWKALAFRPSISPTLKAAEISPALINPVVKFSAKHYLPPKLMCSKEQLSLLMRPPVSWPWSTRTKTFFSITLLTLIWGSLCTAVTHTSPVCSPFSVCSYMAALHILHVRSSSSPLLVFLDLSISVIIFFPLTNHRKKKKVTVSWVSWCCYFIFKI